MRELTRSDDLRIAAFIDAENVLDAARQAGFPRALTHFLRAVKANGRLVYSRAYGDWSLWPCREFLRDMRANVVEMTQLVTDPLKSKNTADIALVVDAMELICSDRCPDILAIITGDRDFVPLVLKARQRGVLVFGLGVRGSVSRELESVCDRFEYIDDLWQDPEEEMEVPAAVESVAATPTPAPAEEPEAAAGEPAPATAAAAPAPRRVVPPPRQGELDLPAALRLLVSAVEKVLTDHTEALGARVAQVMREQAPDFDYGKLGFESFRAFVQVAESKGLVRGRYSDYTDMTISLPESREAPEEVQLSFGTPAEAARSYEMILRERKGVPLIPWPERRQLVEFLWEVLEKRPMPVAQMNNLVRAQGLQIGLRLPDRPFDKLVHTLNIGHCFQDERGQADYFFDLHEAYLKPSVEAAEAIRIMHYTYINGIRMAEPSVPLRAEGLALMLYGPTEAASRQDEVETLLSRWQPASRTIGDLLAGLQISSD